MRDDEMTIYVRVNVSIWRRRRDACARAYALFRAQWSDMSDDTLNDDGHAVKIYSSNLDEYRFARIMFSPRWRARYFKSVTQTRK